MAKIAYSATISDIRGSVGNTVFTKGRSGPTVRINSRGRNPRTAVQTSVRTSLARAAATFRTLTPSQLANWNAYAATLTRKNPVSGRSYTPSAINAFTALATKFLQVSPSGTIPTTPPTSPFAGDTIAVTASGGVGQVTFTGAAPNGSNIRTELLLQSLKSANRTPSQRGYRTKAFFAFVTGTLTQNVAVPKGVYVPAYRFVQVQTGQASPLVTLPQVTVT